METARYSAALVSIVILPPVILYWFIVHSLIGLWRKIGLIPSYVIIFSVLACVAVVGALIRGSVLAIEFGTNWPLIALAAFLFFAGLVIGVQCRRQLSLPTQLGVPEIDPKGSSGVLLKEGIYGRIRHPRYVALSLRMLALAFFVNYLVIYLLVLIYFPAIYIITILEERELLHRFGDEYRQYMRNVPRFIPRMFV